MSGFFCLKIIVDPPVECAIFRAQSGQFRPDGVPGTERFWGAQSASGLEFEAVSGGTLPPPLA